MTSDLHFIRGRNIDLRPLVDGDYGETYLAWLNDPEVNSHSQRRFRPTGPDGLKSFATSPDMIHLAVCRRADGRHVGNVSLGPINWIHRFAEIRILIGDRSAWGQGVGSEAIYLMARHALVTMGLNRVEAGSPNPAFNAAVIDKLGWTEEGRRRQRFLLDGDYVDVIDSALLRRDFKPLAQYEPETE